MPDTQGRIWIIHRTAGSAARLRVILDRVAIAGMGDVTWKDLDGIHPGEHDIIVALLPEQQLSRASHLIARIRGAVGHHPLLVITDTRNRRRLAFLLDQDIDQVLVEPFSTECLLRTLSILQNQTWRAGRTSILNDLCTRMGMDQIVGKTEAFRQVTRRLPSLGQSNATLLIEGETGAGKGLLARAVHYLGSRASGPFIPVNCGGIPDHLLENELFGHAKGAFTDARAEQKGYVHEAVGGTLFLDEIHTLSNLAQVKLLRFMEDRTFKPLGSNRLQHLDARIICASNTSLRDKVARGGFRKDLYYRINILNIYIPPLRKRKEDIPELAHHFVEKFARTYGRDQVFLSESCVERLCDCPWPGNVRELRNIIEKAVAMHEGTILRPEQLDIEGLTFAVDEDETYQEAKKRAVDTFEREFLSRLLKRYGGNVSHAARIARTDRRSLQRLMRKHGL